MAHYHCSNIRDYDLIRYATDSDAQMTYYILYELKMDRYALETLESSASYGNLNIVMLLHDRNRPYDSYRAFKASITYNQYLVYIYFINESMLTIDNFDIMLSTALTHKSLSIAEHLLNTELLEEIDDVTLSTVACITYGSVEQLQKIVR